MFLKQSSYTLASVVFLVIMFSSCVKDLELRSVFVTCLPSDAYQCNVEGKDQSDCEAKVLKINLKCPVYYLSN